MTSVKRLRALCVLAILMSSSWPTESAAFIIGVPNPWLTTASGSRAGNGVPGTLTWSIVPDGTIVPDDDGNNAVSDLNAFLTSSFTGVVSGESLIEQALARWDELSGLSFVRELNDDGSAIDTRPGVLGVRGDIRISGTSLDGPNDTLAFNLLPTIGGDMVIDTDEAELFGSTFSNFRTFRNTVMHEIGHGLGLLHVLTNTDNLLLEPGLNVVFDGPQLDEVRAIQHFWGDAFEEDNNGLGNGTAQLASPLGTITVGDSLVIGADADVPRQTVSSSATDFVSISNINDVDFYSFTVSEESRLSAELTPLGGTFSQSADPGTPSTFDASARSDLSLTIFDSDGVSVLATADETGPGEIEALSSFLVLEPGTYFSSVSGAEDTIQLYMLDLELSPLVEPGDYNLNGVVDAADYTVWRDTLGSVGDGLAADGNGDGMIDNSDWLVWATKFGNVLPSTPVTSVPEPSMGVLFLTGFAIALLRGIHHRRS